jgi:hypothetical protein
MIAIVSMLLVLTVSFVLFGALVRFSENIIRPSSAPSANHLNGQRLEQRPGQNP